MNKDLLMQVFLPTDGERGVSSTGYCLVDDLILASGHAVGPVGTFVDVRPDLREFHKGGPRGDGWLQARVEWNGVPEDQRSEAENNPGEVNFFDVAILKWGAPEGFRLPLDLPQAKNPIQNDVWNSEGYPMLGRKLNNWESVSLGGFVHAPATGRKEFSIEVRTEPEETADWDGASGMPVFVGDTLIGIVRRSVAGLAGQTFAVRWLPVFDQLISEGLLKRSNLVLVNKYRKNYYNDIMRFCNSNKPIFSSLEEEILKYNSIDEGFLNHINKIEEIFTASKEKEYEFQNEKEKITTIFCLLAPAGCDAGVSVRIRDAIDRSDWQVRLLCGSPKAVEVQLKAALGRKAEFRRKECGTLCGRDDITNYQEFEGGIQDNAERARDCMVNLVRSELLSEIKLRTHRSAPDDKIRKKIKALERVRRFYIVLSRFPENEANKYSNEEYAEFANDIQNRYPGVLVFFVDPEETDDDIARYSLLEELY